MRKRTRRARETRAPRSFSVETITHRAPVVQKVGSAIQRINLYPLDSAVGFPNTYPLDSDLSDG